MKSKKEIALQQTIAASEPSPTEIHLRARISELENRNEHLLSEIGSRKEFLSSLIHSVQAIEPLPIKNREYGSTSHSEVHAVVKFSDWHIGEVINPSETEGFGSFNWAIAQKRIDEISDKELDWIGTQRNSYNIPALDVFVEGDLVTGDIHDELRVTNEFPLPVQAAKAGYLLARVITKFAPHFKQVNVWETGGDNHGRLVKKPQSKQKAANNMMFAVYAVANAYLKEHGNLSIVQPEGMKQIIDVAGWKFLSEHGDGVKAWMGIPFYGIQRERGREAIRRMRTDLGFDYLSIGHWHVPSVLEDSIFINGSLSGTSEYDHGAGRHARPSQVSFLVHPRYGYFNFVAWKSGIKE